MKKLHNRKCVGCGVVKDRAEFIKLTVEHSSKEIYVNPENNINGRSAYICKDENCIKTAIKKDRISKSLRKKISDEVQEKIFAVLREDIMLKH